MTFNFSAAFLIKASDQYTMHKIWYMTEYKALYR